MMNFDPNFNDATPATSPVCFVSGALRFGDDWTWTAEALGPTFQTCAVKTTGGLDRAMPEPAHVVTHGTGAYTALKLAAEAPSRFRSLTMIDADLAPALPVVLDHAACAAGTAMRTTAVVRATEGDASMAMAAAVDRFMGAGAWSKTSFDLQRAMARYTGDLLASYERQVSEPMTDMDLAGVVCPVLMVTGTSAPVETQAIHDALLRNIPFSTFFVAAGAGFGSHMTDPHLTHPAIRDFLVRVDQQWQDAPAGVRQAA